MGRGLEAGVEERKLILAQVRMESVKHACSKASFSFPSSDFSGFCASPVEEPHGALTSSYDSRTMTDVSWYFSFLEIL